MSEEKAMNIYQKLQKCRVDLQKKDIKKSNYNEYGKYKYFDLGDFLPYINDLCDEYQLSNIVHYEKDSAVLTLLNMENTSEKLEFITPMSVTPLKSCSEMQSIGAAQTYARKYLYFDAFEIAETDSLDNGDAQVDEQKAHEIKKIDPIRISTIKEMLKKTHSSEKTIFQFFKVKSLEDITNGQFKKVMDSLEKKQEELQKNQAKLKKAKEQKGQQLPVDLGI